MGLNEFETSEEFEDGIEVQQGEWKFIPKGSFGATFGLGPCVGIIIYDAKRKEALLAHLPQPSVDGLVKVVEEARRRFNPKNMKICVGGGAAYRSTLKSCLEERQLIEQELSTLTAGSNINIHWHRFDQNTDMSVNTSTGEIVRDTQDD